MSVRRSVGPSVRRSVGPSVRRSVTHELNFSEKWAKIEQNSIRNRKVCHLKDDSKTRTRAVRQRTHLLSELCSTCFSQSEHCDNNNSQSEQPIQFHAALCTLQSDFSRSPSYAPIYLVFLNATCSLPLPWLVRIFHMHSHAHFHSRSHMRSPQFPYSVFPSIFSTANSNLTSNFFLSVFSISGIIFH